MISRLQHRPAHPHTVVSAYVDGKAKGIETKVLDGVDQFERAVKRDSGLDVTVDGQRGRKGWRTALAAGAVLSTLGAGFAAALGALPLLVGAGAAVAGTLVALPLASNAAQDFEAREWSDGKRYEVGAESTVSPTPKAGKERLGSLLEQAQTSEPQARKVAYFSGHGTQKEIVGIKTEQFAQALKGHQLDISVFDVCLAGQLEVVSKLAPWAGVALVSTHPVPGKGFPIEKLFAPEILAESDPTVIGKAMAQAAAPAAKSLCAVDTKALQNGGLQAIDELGLSLKQELQDGSRDTIVKALRQSQSPRLLSSKVDLQSFLENLSSAPLSPETSEKAKQATEHVQKAIVFQKDKHGLSFDLQADELPDSLKGWGDFIQALDLRRKPVDWFFLS